MSLNTILETLETFVRSDKYDSNGILLGKVNCELLRFRHRQIYLYASTIRICVW